MENTFIYGKNAVIEALESQSREFNRILISNNARSDEKIEKIKELAKSAGIVFQFVNKEKLNQIAIQASKQSERADIMQISIINKKDIEKDCKQMQNVFFAYENSNNKLSGFNGDFAVIIGPEGGFSEQENEHFSSFAKNVSLGNTILRAEVACVASVSMLKAVQNEG